MRVAASLALAVISIVMLLFIAGIKPFFTLLIGWPCFTLVAAQLALSSGLTATHWLDPRR
jgi:hypothetical protein